MWGRQRRWVSLSLPLLQSLPLALLRGQTAHQLLHLPLPLYIPEWKKKKKGLESWPEAKSADQVCLQPVSRSLPAHDLLELLASQEARVLPDFPQGSLVLPLELVLETLPLLLLPGVATLLPIVQPARAQSKASMSGPLCRFVRSDSLCCLYLHLHRLGCEQLQRNRLLLVKHQTRVRRGSVVDNLEDLLVQILHGEALNN